MKINVFGDFVPIERGVSAILEGTAIDETILSHISEADYNVVNLECPVVNNNATKGIFKDGPCLKTSEDTVQYLKKCGFDMVTLANNHLNDYGSEGIYDTFASCKKNDILWVGAGKNLKEAREPQIINIRGLKVGILNICENESSIASDVIPGSNPVDEINNYHDIVQLKSSVDKIIVILHGGSEHYHLPTPRIKKLCHFYADLGVSSIVCHHIHCYSGFEIYNNVPIFYSLGNFFFYRKKLSGSVLWTTGYFVQLKFTEKTVDYEIFPYIQCKDEAKVELMDDEQRISFKKNIVNLNRIILDDNLLVDSYDEWLNKRYSYYISAAQTWACRYYKSAFRRKIVPAGISKRNAMLLLNYIRCESHLDLMLKSLNKYIEKKR